MSVPMVLELRDREGAQTVVQTLEVYKFPPRLAGSGCTTMHICTP